MSGTPSTVAKALRASAGAAGKAVWREIAGFFHGSNTRRKATGAGVSDSAAQPDSSRDSSQRHHSESRETPSIEDPLEDSIECYEASELILQAMAGQLAARSNATLRHRGAIGASPGTDAGRLADTVLDTIDAPMLDHSNGLEKYGAFGTVPVVGRSGWLLDVDSTP